MSAVFVLKILFYAGSSSPPSSRLPNRIEAGILKVSMRSKLVTSI